MKPEQVQKIIADGIPCEGLSVQGDDNYPKALIVSSQFVGKSRVQRQQMVNALLKPYFDSGSSLKLAPMDFSGTTMMACLMP